jgi:hypothetical protein
MKAVFRTLILVLAISWLISPAASAQADQDTPESVAKAYIAATQAADWAKATSFMHPDSLTQFKSVFEPIFANERMAKEMGKFFDIKSRAEYDQASSAQMFEKFMAGIGGLMPGINKMIAKASFDIIGQIAETPDMVHLVYRSRASLDDLPFIKDAPGGAKSVSFTKLEVMTLKRHENTWLIALSDELEAMMQMFAAMSALVTALPAEQSNDAQRKAPSKRAKVRKPARKP